MTTRVRIGLCALLGLFVGCAAEETTEVRPGTRLETGGATGTGGAPASTGGIPDGVTGGSPGVTGGSPGVTGGSPGASTGGTVGTGENVDPVGVWWAELETKGWEELPWVGTLQGTDIRFIMLVEVSGSAPEHQVKFDFCELQTEWIDPENATNITTIGFRPDTVAAFSETITQDLGGLPVGSKVPLPSIVFRGGVDENGEEFDDDGDGNPAVTAWVKTVAGMQIEVFEMIEISATLDLSAPDENTLTGTLDFRADAEIISSNNPIIFPGTPVQIVPDSNAVPITAKRLPNGGDCSTLPSTITFTEVPPPPPVIIPPPMLP